MCNETHKGVIAFLSKLSGHFSGESIHDPDEEFILYNGTNQDLIIEISDCCQKSWKLKGLFMSNVSL